MKINEYTNNDNSSTAAVIAEAKEYKKLWAAVVCQVITDIKDYTSKIERQHRKYGICNIEVIYDIDNLYNDIENPWFYHVCSINDIDPIKVKNYVKAIEEKFYKKRRVSSVDSNFFKQVVKYTRKREKEEIAIKK